MKTKKIFLILLALLFAECEKHVIEPINTESPNNVIVEGTVFYAAAGGTVDLHFPAGFCLMNCQWITQTAVSDSFPYLSGSIDSSFIDKRVRVFGIAQKDTVRDMFNITGVRTIINIDSLRIIN